MAIFGRKKKEEQRQREALEKERRYRDYCKMTKHFYIPRYVSKKDGGPSL